MSLKRAVVLSGGGAKGGYQIGAWQALREIGYSPDIVTGTSVGSFNGALLVSNKFDEAMDLWQNIGMECIFAQFAEDFQGKKDKQGNYLIKLTKEALLKGGADFAPLHKRIIDLVDEEVIRQSDIDFGMVTTTFPYKKQVRIFVDKIPQGQVVDYIFASAAAFPLVRSYKIEGVKFVDGGYSDNLPVQMAIDRGAQEIVAINMGKMSLQRLKENTVKIRYINNKKPLNDVSFGCAAIFDRELSRKNIRLGYLDTMKAFSLYEGHYYTFEKNEKYRFLESSALCSLNFEKVFSVLPSNNRFEKRGRENVLGLFAQFNANPFEYNTNAMYCAEMAAEIFQIDPREIYTFQNISDMLIKEIETLFAEESAEKIARLIEQLDAGLSFELFKTLINSWDKKLLLGFCTRLFLEDEFTVTDKRRLTVVAALFPDVFTAALFCCAAILDRRLTASLISRKE
ncbi:MAG: patatin-like phospholipase family protein [Clostridiales bacterium]|nr:patatin-like phospholipase family protein [Clostridiales bacterium]